MGYDGGQDGERVQNLISRVCIKMDTHPEYFGSKNSAHLPAGCKIVIMSPSGGYGKAE